MNQEVGQVSQRRLFALAGSTVAAMVALGFVDIDYGKNYNPGIIFPALLVVCLWVRRRDFLWLLTILAIALNIGAMFSDDIRGLEHRILSMLALFATAGAFDHLIGAWKALTATTTELEISRAEIQLRNTDLVAREQDIASQNEELRSQTEELERQSEELRVANDELARRERTLESLLRLSRSLTAEMSRGDTLDRICQALGDMVNGPGLGVGVKLKQNDQMHLICHHGFGVGGPANVDVPYGRSFARLVIERNQTGYLEDLAMRPEILIPQPAQTEQFRSILAAPLRVNGNAIGTLEVYSREPRSWSEEQMAMVESLAAQTSISLQAAELFERIEQERNRLRAVLDTIPIGIAIADGGAELVRVNPAGAALIGSPQDANVMSPLSRRRFRLFQAGQELENHLRPIARACRGDIITADEFELLRADGKRVPIMVNAAPIHDGEGAIVGAVAAFIDVTQQKQLQQELDSRRRTAEENSVRKSRFLAQVSHDIRNPVNAINLLAELLYRAASEPTMAGEVPDIAADLRKNSISLINLIGDVLDLTRFESGRIELEESEFALNEMVAEECRTYQSMAIEKGLELHCETSGESLMIRTDRVKLSRVLGNLIGNALKFTESGSIRVSAGFNAGAGRDATGLDGPGVWVRVSDTGSGISPEFHDRIFDEFFQLRNTSGSHGTGLGLSICKRLAEAMGGSMHLKSMPGDGSTFTVTLPISVLVRR